MRETRKATGNGIARGASGDRALFSGEDLARMPGPEPCELVRGRIVLASPTSRKHARVEVRFSAELRAFVEPRRLGEVLAGEAGIYTGRRPDTVRGADVAFLSSERAARCSPDGFLDVAPDLVVEVLSPRDEPAEMERKIEEYLAAGVRLVWVADPDRKTVRTFRPAQGCQASREGRQPAPADAPSPASIPTDAADRRGAEVYSGGDILSGEDVLPGFSVPVSRFFD